MIESGERLHPYRDLFRLRLVLFLRLIRETTATVGTLRLMVPDEIVGSRRIMATLHMIRFDSMPWPCRMERDQRLVTLHRIVNHSGQVCIAYPLPEFGELVLRTGTLPERAAPYSLPLELARGTCDRLRTQIGMWQDAGLNVAPSIAECAARSVAALAEAVNHQSDFDRQTELSHESIGFGLRGIFDLCRQFTREVAALRRDESEPKTKLGVRVSSDVIPDHWLDLLGPEFRFVCVSDPANSAEPPSTPRLGTADIVSQAVIDRRKTMIGPIWDTGKSGLPEEINEITHFDAKRVAARAHFVHKLNQIQEQPDWLYVASGLNGIGHKFLSYPQQMQLVVELLQTVEEFNRQVPVLLSFDHPWSERLAWSVGGSQGLQIADILLRQDVRISGLGLEINLDYWPHGSLPRDPLQWLEIIDGWAQFGLPLFLLVRAPTGSSDPDSGQQDTSVGIRNSFTTEQQTSYLETVVAVALSRPYVQAVLWNEWRDDPTGTFPCAGLFDQADRRKPVADLLANVFRSLCKPT